MDFTVNPRLHGEVLLAAQPLVRETAQRVESRAVALAPRDTGELAASIGTRVTASGACEVYVGTDHWVYPEFGTRYQRAQPFMRPALFSGGAA